MSYLFGELRTRHTFIEFILCNTDISGIFAKAKIETKFLLCKSSMLSDKL